MPLSPQTRLGPYEILGPLGAGGMGEVYRARDTRLGRSVAIKSLPEAFARDPARLKRFEREARLLASLAHPNIAIIYGVEDANGTPHLVLELVEGMTLAERIARQPLPVAEAVEIARQIASALESAHERGVVHRDLKPGNVMLTPGGVVKVLDFGLAKGAEEAPPADSSLSPTISAAMTGAGFILGTAAYMSPEQARGKAVDHRSDIWSLGCVLYECLTGRQAFAGETVTEVLAKVLEREPDWSALPAATPPRVRDVVRKCLAKSAAARPESAAAVRRDLEVSGPTETRAAPPSLAVLYFENLSSDPESDYFCAGITEDILTDLSKIKGMRVASRTAVARFRGKDADSLQVASELGVGAVLEGSVRRAGDRVRISAQLVSAADGFHLWAERYDRTLQDVFAVQEEIASAIAQALRVTLTPAESENLLRDRPADARAYDLYLKGREFYERRTPDAYRYALDLFEQAIAVDPDYALAWAGIADGYGQLLQNGLATDKEETIRLGLEAARRAIALDARLPEAYKAESLVLRYSGELEGSRASLFKALEANPRFLPALINLSVDAMGRADYAGAERLARRALDVEAAYPFAQSLFSAILFVTNREDEALVVADRLRRLTREPYYVAECVVLRCAVYVRRGDMAAARREIREGRAAGANPIDLAITEAVVSASEGDLETARRRFAEAESGREASGWATVIAGWLGGPLHEEERVIAFVTRAGLSPVLPVSARLEPELHALLDYPPLAPRRSDLTLVWPAEAPPLDDVRRSLFADVRVESGMPKATEPIPTA